MWLVLQSPTWTATILRGGNADVAITLCFGPSATNSGELEIAKSTFALLDALKPFESWPRNIQSINLFYYNQDQEPLK